MRLWHFPRLLIYSAGLPCAFYNIKKHNPMSINPNSHRPLNIDQEITRLHSTFQEYNTIDRKQIATYSLRSAEPLAT